MKKVFFLLFLFFSEQRIVHRANQRQKSVFCWINTGNFLFFINEFFIVNNQRESFSIILRFLLPFLIRSRRFPFARPNCLLFVIEFQKSEIHLMMSNEMETEKSTTNNEIEWNELWMIAIERKKRNKTRIDFKPNEKPFRFDGTVKSFE